MLTTSINMRPDVLAKITRAAGLLEKPRREIIVRLMMRVMRDIDRFQGGFTTVRYQPGLREKNWHCFVIRFKPEENEYFTDLRKLSKFSVSFLVAIAVEKYLDKMLEDGNRGIYNYRCLTGYLIHQGIVDGLRCWYIHWGTPKTRHKTPLPGTFLRGVGFS